MQHMFLSLVLFMLSISISTTCQRTDLEVFIDKDWNQPTALRLFQTLFSQSYHVTCTCTAAVYCNRTWTCATKIQKRGRHLMTMLRSRRLWSCSPMAWSSRFWILVAHVQVQLQYTAAECTLRLQYRPYSRDPSNTYHQIWQLYRLGRKFRAASWLIYGT